MRTRIWSVLIVIGILGGIVSFNIFSTNKIREGIKRKDAIIACKENENSYDLEQAGYKEILTGENSAGWYDSEMKGTVVRRETEDGYEVDLYDKLGNRIETRWFPKEPGVRDITDDLVEISISVGSPACYYTYYDRKREKISDTFFNSFLVDNKYVVYMEDAGELIIKDLFDEGLLEKKIVRDFAGIDPRSSVDVELTGEGELMIEYLTGDDYEVVTETIPLYGEED